MDQIDLLHDVNRDVNRDVTHDANRGVSRGVKHDGRCVLSVLPFRLLSIKYNINWWSLNKLNIDYYLTLKLAIKRTNKYRKKWLYLVTTLFILVALSFIANF